MTGLRGYWAILLGCLVLFMSIAWLGWKATTVPAPFLQGQFDPNSGPFPRWMEFTSDQVAPGNVESTTLLDSFQVEADTAQPPICTIENEVGSANGASGAKLYRISMSRDQFATFRQAVISRGADEIGPPENPEVVPLWWNPPKVKSLRWNNGRAYATYDSGRQLLFFRNYELNSENYGRSPQSQFELRVPTPSL